MQKEVTPSLRHYVETHIIPLYDHFDMAHKRDHVLMVIRQSLELAEHLDVNADMVYAIAAFHDTELTLLFLQTGTHSDLF